MRPSRASIAWRAWSSSDAAPAEILERNPEYQGKTLYEVLFANGQVDFDALNPSTSAIAGLVGLAIGPTAMASLLYVTLVQRTSATFLSLTGYTIPIFSAVVGYLAFAELQNWNALLAFALILGGVWISQSMSRKTLTD